MSLRIQPMVKWTAAAADSLRRPRGGGRTRPVHRPDRGPPRRRLRPLRLSQGAARLPGGRGRGPAAVPDGRRRRNPTEPLRADRSPPPPPVPGAGGRRDALVPPQGRGRHGPGGRSPDAAQPAPVRRDRHVTLLPLVLVGGGGHASDVLEVIEAVNAARPTYRVVGILDDHDLDGRRFT